MCALFSPTLWAKEQSSKGLESGQQLSQSSFWNEVHFLRLLCLERKRTERSGRPFLLVLLDGGTLFGSNGTGSASEVAATTLLSCTRDTDIVGWYRENKTMAVLLTELQSPLQETVTALLVSKIHSALRGELSAEQSSQIRTSVYQFPDASNDGRGEPKDFTLYPDLEQQVESKKLSRGLKRAMDVLGSSMLLLFVSPILLLIALIIKLTSRGPILFRQTRVGRYGQKFVFLKFRSMYLNCDAGLHKDYVTKFIAGRPDVLKDDNGKHIYKIKHDPRVTPFGDFLRRTSLDELPQLINVLKGEMSLVGPRPALPYEVARYQLWHRRRFLESKPGITGLWQVRGRSRLTFDEMVRLDLEYCRKASLALDLQILLQTPSAVVSGNGAY